MRLRPASQEDLAALATVHAASFDDPWAEADLAALCAATGAVTLLADDGAVRAFVLARVAAGEAEILTLAVDPAARRQGLARALMTAAILQAEALGAEAMFLEVAADNGAALALYAALGFAAAGTRRGYYARPGGGRIDAAVLRRALNSRGA